MEKDEWVSLSSTVKGFRESWSTIHKEEPCLDLEGGCLQTYMGSFSLEKTRSFVYTGIFAGLPVLIGFIFYVDMFS